MGTKLLTTFATLGLSICLSQIALADCGLRCNPCGRPCGMYETPCQCTDLNAYSNPCLSPDRYCEAFGNVGAR